MAAVNVEKLNRSKLRKLADDLGVKWDKRKDDEERLRKKVTAALAVGEAESEEFDPTKRDATTIEVDSRTKKAIKRPIACFGWYFNDSPAPGKINCVSDCPHWKACAKLSKGAAALLGEVEEDEADTEESDAVTEDDVTEMNAATRRKGGKNGSTLTKGETPKGRLAEETEVVISYDLDWANSVEDDDLRLFYKKLIKKHGEGETVPLSAVLDLFCATQGLDDGDRATVLTDYLPMMLEQGDFKLV
jgi:hypothetical protein